MPKLNWAEIVKFAAKYGTALGVVAVVGWFLLGEYRDWRRGEGAPPVPVVAQPTERTATAPVVTVTAPLQAPVLPPKVVKRIAKDYGKSVATLNPAGEVVDDEGDVLPGGLEAGDLVLTEVELPKLPDGGDALVTRSPGGAVEVTVRPKPRKFFELRSDWAVGALLDPTGTGNWRGYARWNGLRIGRVYAVVEAGGERRASESGAYALVGAEMRFGSTR